MMSYEKVACAVVIGIGAACMGLYGWSFKKECERYEGIEELKNTELEYFKTELEIAKARLELSTVALEDMRKLSNKANALAGKDLGTAD